MLRNKAAPSYESVLAKRRRARSLVARESLSGKSP